MTVTPLILLGRPGCGLCEEMLEALLTHLGEGRVDVQLRSVDEDPIWQRRWGLKIPVLLDVDGSALCVSHYDADAMEAYLQAPESRAG